MQLTRRNRLVGTTGLLVCAAVVGTWVATRAFATDGGNPSRAGEDDQPKGPIAELMRCPLAFAGVHLMKDDPAEARIAYHFCKPVKEDLAQCVLYDGTGSDTRLIGI